MVQFPYFKERECICFFLQDAFLHKITTPLHTHARTHARAEPYPSCLSQGYGMDVINSQVLKDQVDYISAPQK